MEYIRDFGRVFACCASCTPVTTITIPKDIHCAVNIRNAVKIDRAIAARKAAGGSTSSPAEGRTSKSIQFL